MPVKFDKKFLFLVVLFAGSFIPLYARDILIIVEDTDLGLPLEGALIRSWDGQEYTCDAEGKAVIPAPEDRQAVIQIAYPGYENGRLVVPVTGNQFTLGLRMSGILENQELVIEVQKPGTSETRTGRSVAISDRELTQTAEIGIIEDVMTSIKLLPGVGYSGMFNALPSIRGGEPGDLMAAFDGFYISNPYHWGGGASIFDPRMVKSAQLSHGVFSARYGHTISGLLEISSRRPSTTETEAELGISSSATNLNLSFPLWGKGGVMVMGKTTYWDPFIALAKPFVPEVRYVKTAPYIRSAALSVDYRFTPNLELTANSFIGIDGVGAFYENSAKDAHKLESNSDMDFDWDNSLGFFIAGVTVNPLPAIAVKGTIGTGFNRADLGAYIRNYVKVWYSDAFKAKWGHFLEYQENKEYYEISDETQRIADSATVFNVQGRVDLDWDFGKGFLFAFGFQELYTQMKDNAKVHAFLEQKAPPSLGLPPELYLHYPFDYTIDVMNQTMTTSAYTAAEYASPNKRFGAELGLRLDHLYFVGKDFTIQTYPAFNPRLNLDFNILKDVSFIDSLSATVGTGLFSSMNDTINYIENRYGIKDFDLKQNRSWTSVVGTKIDFTGGFSFNIEGYFKYIFDRAYMYGNLQPGATDVAVYKFDGEGIISGFDFMLQKLESRYWDGWISYTFTYARYRNPQGDPSSSINSNWYYPSFHRFHNLNLILNVKPIRQLNITTRLGIVSGRPKALVGSIESYPVLLYDPAAPTNPENGVIIEKWKRSSVYSDNERTTWSIPLDIKVSWYFFNPQGKVQGELYVAVENLMSLVYKAQANTSFNSYTGQEETGSDAAAYEMPLPMPSIGFKWSY
ncbi:MAG: TonB-dependent receptor plug domain-containing protein [Treponema sp.]|jgi:hypothetical protein|nr:TonB-dependent receptor plug domain-containing protein [Treponema sp.]